MTEVELITAAEAGVILGRTPRTIQRLADAGTLTPAHKLPGRTGAYLFRRADVEALRSPEMAKP